MSVAFHKLIIMEKCHGNCRIRFITGLFSHSSKADEPSLSSIQHCSFRQILYLLWRLHHVLVLPICIATLFTIWIHWPQASIPFLEDEFKYMKNLDPVRDSGILGCCSYIQTSRSDQLSTSLSIPCAFHLGYLRNMRCLLFPKESCFSSGGFEFLL